MLFITTSVNISKYFCANFSTLLVMLSSKSLIYIKNNKGYNTDKCKSKFHVLGKKVGGNLIGSVEV